MIDKALCLNSIAQAIRDIGYGAEVSTVGQSDLILLSWKGHGLTNLLLEDVFQFPDSTDKGSSEQVTEMVFEIGEWKVTTSIRIQSEGIVNLGLLPESLEDMREQLD